MTQPRFGWVVSGIVAATLAGAPASVAWAKREKGKPTWNTRVGIEQAYTDNVRSAPSGPQEEGAFFTTLKGRSEWYPRRTRWRWSERRWLPSELALTVRGRLFSSFSNRNTVEIRPSLRYPLGPGEVLLRYGYTPRRLRLEDLEGGDDVFYEQHRLEAGYELKFGPKRALKAAFGGNADWDDYGSAERGRDAFTGSGWASLRYRLHRYFVPRVRLRYGEREARRANYDRNQWSVLGGFDSYLPAGIDVRVRYKYQNRDYPVDSPKGPSGRTNTNFGREDDINQIETTLGAPMPWVAGLRVELRFKLRDGDSTRTSRNFQVREYGIGIVYNVPE